MSLKILTVNKKITSFFSFNLKSNKKINIEIFSHLRQSTLSQKHLHYYLLSYNTHKTGRVNRKQLLYIRI